MVEKVNLSSNSSITGESSQNEETLFDLFSSAVKNSSHAVHDFFIGSNHSSKLEKYGSILEQYITHLGGNSKVTQALNNLEKFDQYNPMVEHATSACRALLGKGQWEGKNERDRYQNFVKELRAAIETHQYQKLKNETAPDIKTLVCVELIKNLVKVRWFKSEMYPHLEKATELFMNKSEGPEYSERIETLSELNFSKTFTDMNNRIKNGPSEIRKRKIALWKQQFEGITGLKDFSGTENISFVRCRYDYKTEGGDTETIHYLRHSRPTVGGSLSEFLIGVITRIFCTVFHIHQTSPNDGETIATDYEEAIHIAKEQGEAIFYVVHQRRTPGIIENEADSTKLIEGLDKKHENFHVLIQSVEGPLFNQEGRYADLRTMAMLKYHLCESFKTDNPESPNCLPKAVRDEKQYHEDLGKMFDEVRHIFFPDVGNFTQLTPEEWQKMILYFYVFQKDDLKFRLSNENYTVKYYTTPCKDFLDRGGNMALVEDFIHYHMAKNAPTKEDLQHTLYTTLGAAIDVKKKEVIEKRLEIGLKIVEDLAKLNESQKTALQEYRFQERKFTSVRYPTAIPKEYAL
jgi:hypothetical protein